MLKVENLQVSYGNVEAVNDVSFHMEKGSLMAVMGRNGVGKTTLMQSLIGILKPDQGKLQFESTDITPLPAYKRVLKGIGYVPQGRQIFPKLTVEENLWTGLRGKEKKVPEEIYEYFPVLAEMRSRFGGDLSGGQQQQLAIGRALTTRPKLLILDEPTEGIQPNIIQRIGEVLNILSNEKDMTILIVEQYLDFIREYTREYFIMNRGSIAASGKTAELGTDQVEEFLHV